jgi:formate hydrogenlyase subunit 3/multisubunit Na+/H+ antiporter MnhD subunit
MFNKQLRYAAVLAFLIALVLTGIGGWSNMIGKAFVITEQHAWNDGLFMMMVAIFLLLLSSL